MTQTAAPADVPPALAARCLAEALGTFVLVFFGCGVVHAAVLTGAQSGLWQVAIVWGGAVAAAILMVGRISGAHVNPAITIALAVWRGLAWRDAAAYVASQVAGAMLAAAVLHVIFSAELRERERILGIERGQPGSEMTAMCYGEFYPNPGRITAAWEKQLAQWERDGSAPLSAERRAALQRLAEAERAKVSEATAFLAEFVGTLLLALVVFAVTDPRNSAGPLTPVIIGLTVAMLISVIAPLTQACLNPARDFGPRLVSCFAGWGEAALPGPNGRGFITVYVLGPVLGALAGGAVHRFCLSRAYPPAN
ncbi:MAG: aquaporin family protein [Gemmataceae bacterium]|nr:aquaporin family protein [Gemmataceae bacterium]